MDVFDSVHVSLEDLLRIQHTADYFGQCSFTILLCKKFAILFEPSDVPTCVTCIANAYTNLFGHLGRFTGADFDFLTIRLQVDVFLTFS